MGTGMSWENMFTDRDGPWLTPPGQSELSGASAAGQGRREFRSKIEVDVVPQTIPGVHFFLNATDANVILSELKASLQELFPGANIGTMFDKNWGPWWKGRTAHRMTIHIHPTEECKYLPTEEQVLDFMRRHKWWEGDLRTILTEVRRGQDHKPKEILDVVQELVSEDRCPPDYLPSVRRLNNLLKKHYPYAFNLDLPLPAQSRMSESEFEKFVGDYHELFLALQNKFVQIDMEAGYELSVEKGRVENLRRPDHWRLRESFARITGGLFTAGLTTAGLAFGAHMGPGSEAFSQLLAGVGLCIGSALTLNWLRACSNQEFAQPKNIAEEGTDPAPAIAALARIQRALQVRDLVYRKAEKHGSEAKEDAPPIKPEPGYSYDELRPLIARACMPRYKKERDDLEAARAEQLKAIDTRRVGGAISQTEAERLAQELIAASPLPREELAQKLTRILEHEKLDPLDIVRDHRFPLHQKGDWLIRREEMVRKSDLIYKSSAILSFGKPYLRKSQRPGPASIEWWRRFVSVGEQIINFFNNDRAAIETQIRDAKHAYVQWCNLTIEQRSAARDRIQMEVEKIADISGEVAWKTNALFVGGAAGGGIWAVVSLLRAMGG